jgi:hypothetical protein
VRLQPPRRSAHGHGAFHPVVSTDAESVGYGDPIRS